MSPEEELAALLRAAAEGHVDVMMRVSDWFLEQDGNRATNARRAREFRIYAAEMDMRRIQGRLVRELLPLIPRPPRLPRFSEAQLRQHFASSGLPIDFTAEDGQPVVLIVPADGEDEGQTERVLLAHVEGMFPGVTFDVVFRNTPMSPPGVAAAALIARSRPPESV